MGRRDQDVHFLASKEEVQRIHEKMDELGIRSMGAYLRKMALDGYCINLDLQDVKELVSLLRRCSNNLNQYAKRANETGNIYESDIKDLQERLEENLDRYEGGTGAPVQYSVIIKMAVANKIAAAVHIDIVVLSAVRRYNKNRKGCVTVRILGFFVKIILKLIALPVLLGLGIVCLLAKIAFELSSFFIGALILYIIGCSIYCVFQSLWLQLALLVGIGLAVYAALFLFVVFQEIGENIKENLRDFIFS